MTASLLEKMLLIVSDALAFFISFVLAYWIQFHSGWIPDKYDPSKSLDQYIVAGYITVIAWIALFALTGLYRRWLLESRTYQVLRVMRTTGFGTMLIFVALFGIEITAYAFHERGQNPEFLYGSRFWLVVGYALSLIVVTSLFRLQVNQFLRGIFALGYGYRDRLLILGVNDNGREVAAQIRNRARLGQEVVGFVDERFNVLPENSVDGLPLLGKYSDLKSLVKQYNIRGIVISHQSTSHNEILRVLKEVVDLQVHIYVIPDLYDVISGHFHANFIHGLELKELFPHHMPLWQVRMKRMMDVGIAALLLLLTLPLTLISALLIKIEDNGPIFYSQERVGLYGRGFLVYKFRTMRTDAEKFGPQWAKEKDPRITKIGRFLRRSRIDELPQLWCVLKGDMSMVGPRPERQFFIDQLKEEIPLYISRLKMKPGLTGWAQVRHHYDTSFDSVEKKLKFDLYYFENMSLLLDVQILVRTIWVVLTGKGAL